MSCLHLKAMVQAELPTIRPKQRMQHMACALVQPRPILKGNLSDNFAFFRIRSGRSFVFRVDEDARAIVHLHDDGRLQLLGKWIEPAKHNDHVRAQDRLGLLLWLLCQSHQVYI